MLGFSGSLSAQPVRAATGSIAADRFLNFMVFIFLKRYKINIKTPESYMTPEFLIN
jgi:hypothetical protein